MNLLLDLGNSRLKWALAEADDLHAREALQWAGPDFDARVLERWRAASQPQRILVADVAGGERRARIEALLAECFTAAPQWLRAPASMAGLYNAYPQPARLGIDRFLALLAAHGEQRAPCVIANCGSALTLDALGPDGHHLGGLIAPGVVAMRRALFAAAPGLVDADDGTVVDWAVDTNDAVQSGVWQAVAGAIERFYRRAAPALGGAPQLLLSGGDAAALAALLEPPASIFADAVLRGLHLWSRHA